MNIFGFQISKASAPKKSTKRRASTVKNAHRVVQSSKYDALGHRVADLAREQGIGAITETGDSASRYERETLVNLTRQVEDENLVFASISDRMVTNLVGANGFSLQARTGNDDLNRLIEDVIWKEFTERPEYRDLFSWEEVQAGVCKEMIGVGDVGFIKLKNGQLQAVESEWINSPTKAPIDYVGKGRKIEQGVEQTLGGKVLGFWINPPAPEGYPSAESRRIDKKDFVYVNGRFQRFSRTRPLPTFIQAMSSIWRLDDILDSEALCWQLLARIAFIVNKQGEDEEAYENSEDIPESSSHDMADRLQDIGTGLIMHGSDGDKVEGVQRNLPGKDFPASVRAFMQLFSMRIGLPLEILMLDWSHTNFSSGKAALTQAGINIHKWQANEVRQFHAPTYNWVISRAVEEGRLPDIPEVYNHEWFPPMPPWIDAKEEAESWGIRVDRGLVTFSDALKHQGKDRETENERRKADIMAAIEISNDMFDETGIRVDWKYFAGYQVGKTDAAFMQLSDDEKPGDDNPKMEAQKLEEGAHYLSDGKLFKVIDGAMTEVKDG